MSLTKNCSKRSELEINLGVINVETMVKMKGDKQRKLSKSKEKQNEVVLT